MDDFGRLESCGLGNDLGEGGEGGGGEGREGEGKDEGGRGRWERVGWGQQLRVWDWVFFGYRGGMVRKMVTNV